jgi:hypothetical protein
MNKLNLPEKFNQLFEVVKRKGSCSFVCIFYQITKKYPQNVKQSEKVYCKGQNNKLYFTQISTNLKYHFLESTVIIMSNEDKNPQANKDVFNAATILPMFF